MKTKHKKMLDIAIIHGGLEDKILDIIEINLPQDKLTNIPISSLDDATIYKIDGKLLKNLISRGSKLTAEAKEIMITWEHSCDCTDCNKRWWWIWK